MSLNRPLFVRAASSATVTVVLLSAFVLYLVCKDGFTTNALFNAIVLVSGLWVVVWPVAIAMSAAKRLGTAWDLPPTIGGQTQSQSVHSGSPFLG